jgi:signal transduction histidine kinase
MRYGDGNVYGAGLELCRRPLCTAGWRHIHPAVDRVSARRWVPSGPARPNVGEVSADPAAKVALATLRRARAQQEAAHRWLRRLTPPLFVLVAVVVFTNGRNPGPASRDVGAAIAVTGLALGVLSALKVSYRRAAVRIIFAVMLLASSAALMRLQPDGPGLAGLLTGLVLLPPRVPDRFPIALSIAGIACLAALAVAVSHDSPAAGLTDVIAIVGFPGMTLLARRLGQANHQAERLLIELEGTRAAQAQAARLAERQRLAREMHDVLAHSLSGLMLQLEGARMLAADDPGDPQLPEIIERARQLSKSGLEEARRAIGLLRDDELPGPGPERLAGLAAHYQEVSGVPCQLTVSGPAYELSSEARLAVYRVAQEALTNITKHACPERVEVHLGYEPRHIRLSVENFAISSEPPPPADDSPGYGLTGMRERAELLGGELTTAMTHGSFRVELRVPA